MASQPVESLKFPRELPVKQVPAIGYSIVANIGGERQFTAQCFVEQDESDAEVNAKVDRIMKLIDRQKAIYGMKDLKLLLKRESLQLFNGEQQINEEETKYEASVRQLEERKVELVEARAAIQETAAERGRAKPVGADGSRYAALGAEIRDIDKQLAANAAGREAALGMAAPGIDKMREIVADIEVQIAEAQALIDGG